MIAVLLKNISCFLLHPIAPVKSYLYLLITCQWSSSIQLRKYMPFGTVHHDPFLPRQPFSRQAGITNYSRPSRPRAFKLTHWQRLKIIIINVVYIWPYLVRDKHSRFIYRKFVVSSTNLSPGEPWTWICSPSRWYPLSSINLFLPAFPIFSTQYGLVKRHCSW